MKSTLVVFASGILFLQQVVIQQFKLVLGAVVARENGLTAYPSGYTPHSTVACRGTALTPSVSFPIFQKPAFSIA